MPTSAEVRAHVATVAGLTTLMVADLEQVWESLDGAGVTDTRQALVGVLPDLTGVYASAVGLVAVEWYESLRRDSGVRSSFAAVTADPPGPRQLEEIVRWGVAPMAPGDGFVGDRAAAFAHVAGSVERTVLDVDRQTQVVNARRDPARPRFARDTAADACAWCAMLATRGAAYRSAESASASHDHCKCVPVPEFPDNPYQPPDHYAAFEDAYTRATLAVGGAGRQDVKPILAHMRTLGYR